MNSQNQAQVKFGNIKELKGEGEIENTEEEDAQIISRADVESEAVEVFDAGKIYKYVDLRKQTITYLTPVHPLVGK